MAMSSADTIKFLRTYGNMNKYDLITYITKRYDESGYFGNRKVWIKRTFGELLGIIYEFELQDAAKEE